MGIEAVTTLILAIMLVLMVIGLPLAFVTALTAGVVAIVLFGSNGPYMVVSRVYTLMNNYALISVPLFVLMGCLLEQSGIVEGMFRAIHKFTARIPGGLAVATIVAATIMAAMVGVIGAEIVTLGLVCLPAMLRRGYDPSLVCGVVCAGGSLGTMIPPSILLIVYGLIAQVSIGQLFMASVLPGLLLAVMYTIYVIVICSLRPHLAPRPVEEPSTREDRIRDAAELVPPVVLIACIMAAFYTGIATPTEVGALGVLGALIILAMRRRFTLQSIQYSVVQTGRTVAMVTWIFFGASALVGVYTLAGGTEFIKVELLGLNLSPFGTLAVMMVILLVLGCFVDWIAIALLTMPIFVPIVRELGYDPIWFGVLFALTMQISYLSPPFGPAAFYLKGVAPPNISLGMIFNGVWPFIGLQLLALGLVMLFPQIALYLPSLTR